MPPRKRAASNSTTTRSSRGKRPRLSELREVGANTHASHQHVPTPAPQGNPGQVSIDANALSTTISTAVAQAVQSTLSQNNIAAILTPRTTDGFGCIESAVASATGAIVVDSGSSEGTGDVPYQPGCSDPQPRQVFTSKAVGLTSRVGAKLKGKIWANEYVDFGSLLFSDSFNDSFSRVIESTSTHP